MSTEAKLSIEDVFREMYPYRGRLASYDRLPEKGRPRDEILAEMQAVAAQEDARWQTGQVSGSYYHGGMEHYAFLNEVFGLFSHVNLLQRDICPSGTKYEGEILAMTGRMLHGEGLCGAITS